MSYRENWFKTLSEALESENIVHMWPNTPIGYGQTIGLTFQDGTRYGHFVSVYRDSNGLYERPIHYARG